MNKLFTTEEGRKLRPSKFIPYIILVCAGFLYYLLYLYTPFSVPCPFWFVTSFIFEDGLMCPGCGITRMLNAQLHLDFKSAFYENQVVFIIQPFIYYEILKLIVADITETKVKYSKIENNIIILIVIILIIFGILRNLYRLT